MSEMYLTLFENSDGSAVDVGISIADAMSFTAEDFADLYMGTVYAPPGWRAKRKHRKAAMEWGAKQVEARAFFYRQAEQAAL